MNLAPLAAARAPAKIAWTLLFVKAYAIVASRRPELRRAWIPLPWPHLFESKISLASVAIERDFEGEAAVFFGLLREPDRQPLAHLQSELERWRQAPFTEIREFRRLIRYSRLPWPIRRLLWCYGLNISGAVRAKNFGTFGISITAGSGATALNLIAPVATVLNYSPFDGEHSLDVRLHFDHRVLDGQAAARALAELEMVLNGEITRELSANRP